MTKFLAGVLVGILLMLGYKHFYENRKSTIVKDSITVITPIAIDTIK